MRVEIWSHPPESNRRPTDYESKEGCHTNQEDPGISNDLGSLRTSSLGLFGSLGKQLRSLKVDDQFEIRWLLYGKFSGLGIMQNVINVVRGAPPMFSVVSLHTIRAPQPLRTHFARTLFNRPFAATSNPASKSGFGSQADRS
jgi:hypothetical protein